MSSLGLGLGWALPWSTRLSSRSLFFVGISLGFSISLSLTGLALFSRDAWKRRLRKQAEALVVEIRAGEVLPGVEGLIGNTPLVRINSLSDLTGVEILGKAEYLNPFGSVKDRVALRIIQEAEEEGLISPHTGCCIFEGTSGSTGISIAGIARARGYKAHIVLPEDVSAEKVQLLEALGAEVEKVRPVSIVSQSHYVNLARRRAREFSHAPPPSPSTSTSSPSPSPPPSTSLPPRGIFANQFENLANLAAHEAGTAVEIWRQTNGNIDAFVSGAGTGGTIAGVGRYLKGKMREMGVSIEEEVLIVLADPQGSGLFHKVQDGVMYSQTEEEGKRRRYQVDTVVEGIGLNRLTQNFSQALPYIDDAYRVTDEEAVAMSRHLAQTDGLFLGSSAAVNLVTCVRLARKLKLDAVGGGEEEEERRKTIVTILCDSGSRHLSRFWNDEYLQSQGIPVTSSITAILNS